MRGRIHFINRNNGFVAVETQYDDFSVFERIGDFQVEVDDKVEWEDATRLGKTGLKNLTRQTSGEVSFQKHYILLDQLKNELKIG